MADSVSANWEGDRPHTQAKRSGAVLEVSKNEIKVWRLPQRQMQKVAWVEQ
jgi:hypothetical protein